MGSRTARTLSTSFCKIVLSHLYLDRVEDALQVSVDFCKKLFDREVEVDSTGKMRCQFMTDHCGGRFAAAPAGIRLAGSVRTVA